MPIHIDAMSLADTLEGYPDLFVSALTGDSLSGGNGGNGQNRHPDQDHPMHESDILAAS